MMTKDDILQGLNEPQKQAVTAAAVPLLVVAGPGTGKTLTIVRRIAWLVHQGVNPANILAVTFTNRAAREMSERTGALLGDQTRDVFIGTFHLLGLRILRETLGSDLTLLGREEQTDLLKPLVGDSSRKARTAAERISRIKNGAEKADKETRGLMERYQTALRDRKAFDFDDLILTPVELLADPAVLSRYRNRFRYLIIDEYQDINPLQYRLIKLIAEDGGGLCAVGDPDQAIYAFRGSDLRNFLDFEQDFPKARRITLSENYRSSGAIVQASGSMIRNNRARLDKNVNAVRDQGARLTVLSLPDEQTEAAAIAGEIEGRMGGTSHYRIYTGAGTGSQDGSYGFSDFAVIYRTNAQAKVIEEAFNAAGIPCQVLGRGGTRQNKERDEMIAYLRSVIGEDGPGTLVDGNADKLLTLADQYDPRADAVALMTMHMAKGLEFRVVFIAGAEDGLVPYTLMKEVCDIEEERRLFYVGMTRAKDELFLLHSRIRFLYGRKLTPEPSLFLGEIPSELKDNKLVPDRKKKQSENAQMGLF